MPQDYRWSPIADLPEDANSLSDGELKALIEVWQEQKSGLSETAEVEEFTKRLCREWAIETGIIEGAYTLGLGATQVLIASGIQANLIDRKETDRDPAETAAIIQDQLEAVEGLFAFVKGERKLTTGYINELHSILMRHQPTHRVQLPSGEFTDRELKRGVYKTTPNSPTRPDGTIFEYCPPEHVAAEMDRLVSLHAEHHGKGVRPEIEAAWLHHAFSQIHPFSDGNGRVARAIASLVFIRAGAFPLVVNRDQRNRYIGTLEHADRGELVRFVAYLVECQRWALISGIHSVLGATRPAHGPDAVLSVQGEILAARDILLSKGEIGRKEWDKAKTMARNLNTQIVNTRLGETQQMLQAELGELKPGTIFQLRDERGNWDTRIRGIANDFRYSPNMTQQHVSQLHLKWQHQFDIVISIHPPGERFHGVMAGVMVFAAEGQDPISATDDMFQFNYRDDQAVVANRMAKWLEVGLARALAAWRKTL